MFFTGNSKNFHVEFVFSPFGMVLRLARSSFGRKPDSRRSAGGGEQSATTPCSPRPGRLGPPIKYTRKLLERFVGRLAALFWSIMFSVLVLIDFCQLSHLQDAPKNSPGTRLGHDFAGFWN